MSTNQTTAGEVMYRTNRRKFLGYLSAAPTLTAFARAGLLSTQSAFADTGPLDPSSTILYFDGKARDFQDSTCSGTQSSRRLDARTVEILPTCAAGSGPDSSGDCRHRVRN